LTGYDPKNDTSSTQRIGFTTVSTTSAVLILLSAESAIFVHHYKMTFSSVTDIFVSFQAHPHDSNAHKHLNNVYTDTIANPERLYVDPNVCNVVKDNTDLLALVRQIITFEVIAPYATLTADAAADIKPIIDSAALFAVSGNTQRRLNKDSLTRVLDAAVTGGKHQIQILISLARVCFDNSSGSLNYLDWSCITTTATPSVAPPTAPATATDIALAVAASMPVPATATELAAAFATVFPAPAPGGGGIHPTTTSSGASTVGSMYLFNFKALPADVRTRYQNKIANGIISGSTVSTRYAGGNFYHEEGVDTLILADGSYFMIQDPNEKEFMRASVNCEDDTHAGIRSWYENFVKACHDYGFYAHPLWCFRRDHGGDRGFSIGLDPDDDLPTRFDIPISRMSQPLYRMLAKKDMFPRNSNLPTIVRACNGDGYKALKGIIFKSHPAFYDQPSTLIKSYPLQRDLSILEYYQMFRDYEQLRAYIANITAGLDDTTELDIFINNAKHSTYLNRVTRDERRLTSLAHKYRGTQLIETLNKFLMAPDSPALHADNKPRYSDQGKVRYESAESKYSRPYEKYGNKFDATKGKFTNYGNKFDTTKGKFRNTRQPLTARVNPVHYVSDDPNGNGSGTDTEEPGPDLYDIDVPNTDEDREVFHVYCASVYRINAQPDTARDTTCIVCGQAHRFDKCNVLANTEFLRGHYIRYCQQLRRDATARKKEFPGKGDIPNTAATAPVRFLDLDTTGSDSESDDDDDPEQDFQRGRA
jgi:hypothetical protein